MDVDLGRLTAARESAPVWARPWIAWLDVALHREILRLRAGYELSLDEMRGLYISDEQVDRIVAAHSAEQQLTERFEGVDRRLAQLVEQADQGDTPIARICRGWPLSSADVVALVACLAAEVDSSYPTLYAYLNDDAARRLPTVDLIGRLAGTLPPQPHQPLVFEHLVLTHPAPAAPQWLATGLTLSEPVRQYLLGIDPLCRGPVGNQPRMGLVLLESRWAQDAESAARELTGADEQGLVLPDPLEPDPDRRLRSALLRARLNGAAVLVPYLEPGSAADDEPLSRAAEDRLLMLVEAPVTVLLMVRPGTSQRLPLACVDHQRIVVDRPEPDVRRELWTAALARHGMLADESDLAQVADLFDVGPGQISVAATAAARMGRADLPTLSQAARQSAEAAFDGLAQRVAPSYTWDDLVLPGPTRRRLRDLQDAVRTRHQVFDTWGLARLAGGHTSVRALFSGPSGTGKTMSACVVAAELGLELHRVDLSAVVSKYIGETEKNLARIFSAAEDSSAVLFFDEADALFGKRTEVKDSHDRYANIETSFLLQRMEGFDGVVILATNLAANLDEAFNRRIHFRIEFPMPDQDLRQILWRKALPPAAPVAADVDPAFLAAMFPMTGGDIRSACLMAAFSAASQGRPIGMDHLVSALARLRRQQGNVPSVTEFKGYLHLVRDEDAVS